MRDVQTKFLRGKVVRERYIVEELLGQGGFGAVYRVRDRRVRSNIFALKEIIDPTKQQQESFAFEGEILKRLDHPALPHVYRVFRDHQTKSLYMLMDYVAGPNLERLRQQQEEQRFSLAETLRIIAPIVDAIIYLHAQHPPIIHRDIKPSNIIVPSLGHGAVLVDFGTAKEYHQDATTTAIRHCSPGYAAPEQYSMGTSICTDIYGLAATIYTLLTGEVPIDALYRMTRLGTGGTDPLEPVHRKVPEIPVFVAEVLQRAMALSGSDRFATVEDFWQTLQGNPAEQLLPSMPEPSIASLVAIPTSAHAPVRRKASRSARDASRKKTIMLVLVSLILLVLLSGGLLSASQWSGWGGPDEIIIIPTAQTLHLPLPTARLQSTVVPPSVVSPSSSPTTQPTRASASPTVTPIAQPTVSATPTVVSPAQPTASPTVAPSDQPPPPSYPVLVNRYVGAISDQFITPFTNSSLVLSQLQQHGTQISGVSSMGPKMSGEKSFTGTVSADNIVRLTMPSRDGQRQLFFQGQIQPDGSMIGTYCSLDNHHCNLSAGEYGNWHVVPATSGRNVAGSR